MWKVLSYFFFQAFGNYILVILIIYKFTLLFEEISREIVSTVDI